MQLGTKSYSPLVVHVVYRLAVGGLENGLVNLINHMPSALYRHVIVCLTESTPFRNRIKNQGVSIVELKKEVGQEIKSHLRFWKIMRKLRPDIVHTRNLATLEFQLTAALAGVQGRVHGEHGRDSYDLDGMNFKYKLLRKAMRPLVHRYTAVSVDLANWLTDTIRVKSDRLTQIYNGVDVEKFKPRPNVCTFVGPDGFLDSNSFVLGTVGRMEAVKDQLTLVRAFISLLESDRKARERLRLIIIGDGCLRQPAMELLQSAHAETLAWLPGNRDDVAKMLRLMNLFLLPSLREGISNTLLEAMATGLPVIATNVGGNPELVEEGLTGMLVPHSDPIAMAGAIRSYLDNPGKVRDHGRAARQRVLKQFSMDAMVSGYLNVYDAVLQAKDGTTHSTNAVRVTFHRS